MKKIKSFLVKCTLLICFLTTAQLGCAQTRIKLVYFDMKTTTPTQGYAGLNDLSVTNWSLNAVTETIKPSTSYGASNWTGTSFNTTNAEYMEFTLTPTNGLDINCDSISATYKRGGATSPENIRIAISKDNFSSYITLQESLNISGTTQIAASNTLATPFHVANGETAKVRIYAWKTTATGAGAILFVNLELWGTATSPLKPRPSAHVTSFSAGMGTTINTVTLTWNDVADADGYLIKTTTFKPIDGIAESDTISTVHVVNKGVQSCTFSPLCENTSFTFSIYPFSNFGTQILYFTGGTVPTATFTTPIESDVSPSNCADALLLPKGTDNQWVKGYIVGVIQTTDPYTVYIQPSFDQINVLDPLISIVNMNILLADNSDETEISKMYIVKLSESYMRRMLNLQTNFSNLNKQIILKGKTGIYTIGATPYTGLVNLYNYRWSEISAIDNQFISKKISVLVNGNEILIGGELQKDAVVSLFNLQGKRIKQIQADENEIRIKVDVKGIYLLSVDEENSRYTQKVVIL